MILPKERYHTQWVCLPTTVRAIMIIPLKYADKAHHPGNSRLLSNQWLTLSQMACFSVSCHFQKSVIRILLRVLRVGWANFGPCLFWWEKDSKCTIFASKFSYPLRNTSCGIAKYSRNSQRELILRFQHLPLTPASCVTELVILWATRQSIFPHLCL